jgi:hypothetical protein
MTKGEKLKPQKHFSEDDQEFQSTKMQQKMQAKKKKASLKKKGLSTTSVADVQRTKFKASKGAKAN